MDFTEQSPVILSLCPGMLGLERGFERACERIGWKRHTVAAYVEIEAFIVWNLVTQMENGVLDPAPIHTNVKNFPYEILRGKVHGILGGYPCQPFSVAGKGKGTEDPRHLWPYIKAGIDSIRPVFCFFENVRNHLNIGYEEVKGDLESLGYEVREGIYSAEEVGAPHKRDRIFILAIRKDQLANAKMPKCQQSGNTWTGRDRFADNSNELDNASSIRQQSDNEIQSRRDCSIHASETMADSDSSGSGKNSECCELRTKSTEQSSGYCGDYEKSQSKKGRLNRWPARPGEDQYEWEQPRVKPRLGFTVNGYNFREDLLRMAGNGVVEQVAEIALLDLLSKF